jgi:hypothetical protein
MDDIIIKTQDDMRISVSQWDDGGAWLHLASRVGTTCAVLTRSEALALMEGLRAVLDQEVAA